MVEYTDQDREDAGRIAVAVFRGENVGGLEEGFSIADIQAGRDELFDDLEILESADRNVPAMEIPGGPPAPIALSLLVLPWGEILPGGGRRRLWRYSPAALRAVYIDVIARSVREMENANEGIVSISPGQARESFIARAGDFLAVRLAALRRPWSFGPRPWSDKVLLKPSRKGMAPTRVPACAFAVSTNTRGLSAFWSGAYLISRNYHAAPTSPAIGPLQAGTYIFGVNGLCYGKRIRWDRQKVCTLPGVPWVHLDY